MGVPSSVPTIASIAQRERSYEVYGMRGETKTRPDRMSLLWSGAER